VNGSTSVEVKDIQIDSRKIKPGSVFVAVKGGAADGHQFIEKAIENGAAVIVYEEEPATKKEGKIYVEVENSGAAAADMANNFYGRPSEKIKLVGVTGTNGKTTIATLL
jgi:UDP-N-acetylmuramoyl-L-alanyl-D-glutamate--2,6-diaminopimelate ligase